MKKLSVFLVLSMISFASFAATKLTDDQIKKKMIQESVSSYSGKCPCPYNVTRNGSQCGRRSAYSKPRGAAPLCYASDITPEMLKSYKMKQGF